MRLPPTLFKMYGEMLVSEGLERLVDFKIKGSITKTIEYAVDVVLLAKTEEEL